MAFGPEGDPIKCVIFVKISGGKFTVYGETCP
jgi:hypothetical protein